MTSSSSDGKLLNYEDQTGFYRSITVRGIKIRNQYGSEFSSLIEKYKTPSSICGYVATAVSKYCAEAFSGTMSPEQVNDAIKPLVKDGKFIRKIVGESMKSIQNDRKAYIETYGPNFEKSEEKKAYLKDWVANYEISDLFRATGPRFDNLYFARWCILSFPDQVSRCKHEEKRRHFEEEPFVEQKTFLEAFNPRRELFNVDEFISRERDALNFNHDKPMVFVGDLLGHYVTFVALKIKLENGDIQNTVLLLDSTKEKYLNNYASAVVLKMICRAAFSGSLDMSIQSPL